MQVKLIGRTVMKSKDDISGMEKVYKAVNDIPLGEKVYVDYTNFAKIRDEFILNGGLAAGICYMKDDYSTLSHEAITKTAKRADLTLQNGHHSVYDHTWLNFTIEKCSKAFAMLLNNEKFYVTSEKSSRYTMPKLSGRTKEIYDGWLDDCKDLIRKKYQNEFPKVFNEIKIQKLAQENARYFISIYEPTTTLEYSTSFRQMNYLYGMMQKVIDTYKNDKDEADAKYSFYKPLIPELQSFCHQIEGLIVPELKDNVQKKGREFSLVNPMAKNIVDHFSCSYETKYRGTPAQLAQAQRHRTINYCMIPDENNIPFIPNFIGADPEYEKKWKDDFLEVADTTPQGTLVTIAEFGTLDDFILKAKERLCFQAQAEIRGQTAITAIQYNAQYGSILGRYDPQKADELNKIASGARCKTGYECKNPCGFTPVIRDPSKSSI